MREPTIVTIGRRFGSGGHEVGNRLAARLDIPLYDHNLIAMAARNLNLTRAQVEGVDETILGKFLSGYVVSSGDYTMFMKEEDRLRPLSDRVYDAQAAIIRKLASRGPCIFVGRCADYVLGDYSNQINTFIYSYKDDRVRRVMDIYNLTEKEAEERMKKIDKARKQYYEVHTGREWGSVHGHAIILNTSLLGIDGAVDVLEGIYHKWEEKTL